MSGVDIFNSTVNLGDSEDALETNAAEFDKVIESRRSVRIYTDDEIPEAIMKKCLHQALLAPNSSNLQPWQFFWVRDINKKNKLVEYCLSQPSAKTAKELVVAVARPDFWKQNREQMLRIIEKKDPAQVKAVLQYYQKIVPLVYNQGFLELFGLLKRLIVFFRALKIPTPRGPVNRSGMLIWAHKSTALACQNFMLAMRANGFDSCPMEGMDPVRIKKLLELPSEADICMVISAGKRAKNGVYGSQIRFNEDQFIKIV
ncbi:MAG: nitroreductase family protein [Saprospiraceae bacterium]|nr:nitroreductase family protein [Saprospiraceae bacterium]